MEKVGCSSSNHQDKLQEHCHSSDPEFVSSEEQEVRENLYSRLHHVPTLKNEDIDIICKLALQLARFNSLNAKRVYYMLQYLLERKSAPGERNTIIMLIDRIVVAEYWEMHMPRRIRKRAPQYIPVINEHLANLSYASDEHRQGEVREYLHRCIASWIKLGVSHRDSLVALHQAEKDFVYNQPRPVLEIADNSPSEFDLVFQGLAGLGYEANLPMWELVQRGICEGQQDGWINRNENGDIQVQYCR